MLHAQPQISAASPRLWIRRLSLYASTDPLKLIRTVSFERGLNLVVGVEVEGIITGGHSVGKSSLCRLLRYGLGDAHFAESDMEDVISKQFTQGWMTIDVLIDGESWGVARPFNHNLSRNRAKRGEQAEMLLAPDFQGNEFAAYLNALDSLVPLDSTLQWKELLPWLTRDQECSFTSMNQWRAKKNDPGNPKDPEKIMRSVLVPCNV
jgi:uncharacterized protein YydD (DUF2326 family)